MESAVKIDQVATTRRVFLAALPPLVAARAESRPPRILLRGSWQSVNIGDIGHTPGALALLEKHFPEAEITLWPGRLGHGSRELLSSGYPRLKIAEGGLDAQNRPTRPRWPKPGKKRIYI
jgi:hypothetical protein